jgi:purine-nucleoside phosphorylase
VVAVEDHVNLLGENPLCGEQPDGYLRFVPLDDAYDEEMLNSISPLCAGRGVYAAMKGPSYESRAEIRMLASFGVSLVGMSSIPEAIAARQAKMRVATISVVSNMATGMSTEAGSHDEVLEMVKSATPKLASVVRTALLA